MHKLMKSPGSIGRLTMKNRVVMPAMGVNLSARDGGVSDDIIAFYEARAAGGVGLIISEAVNIPVIAVCNIKEPETGEQLLEEGVCDFIGVGRGHLADPEWCNKTFQGRKDEIRLCIGCLACFNEICKLHRVKCAVNPVTGREREYGGAISLSAKHPRTREQDERLFFALAKFGFALQRRGQNRISRIEKSISLHVSQKIQ